MGIAGVDYAQVEMRTAGAWARFGAAAVAAAVVWHACEGDAVTLSIQVRCMADGKCIADAPAIGPAVAIVHFACIDCSWWPNGFLADSDFRRISHIHCMCNSSCLME